MRWLLAFSSLAVLFGVALAVVAVSARSTAVEAELARIELLRRDLEAEYACLVVSRWRWSREEVLQEMWLRYEQVAH